MKAVLEVKRKGIVIIPKRFRDALGISEGDKVTIELEKGKLVLKPLRPKIVDISPETVEALLKEEEKLEDIQYRRIVHENSN